MALIIQQFRLDALRAACPEIEQGEVDFHNGKWRDVPGHTQSMVYELGRAIAAEPPQTTGTLPGLVRISADIERILRDLS